MQPLHFEKLTRLIDYTDEVFEQFYRELLSNKVFAKHFSGDDQVKLLLEKQKQNFIATLHNSEQDLTNRYYRIGVVHFEHDIPYEVFLNGIRILHDVFSKTIQEKTGDINLVLLNDALFRIISEAMAKGYLDVFIRNEITDVEKILVMTRNATFGDERKLLVKHYSWVLSLLTAVDRKDFSALGNLLQEQSMDSDTLYAYIEKHLEDIDYRIRLEEIERVRFRILANTESIFFYLQREAYSEALALIIHILEIYKLTLVLDNVISNIIVKKAESEITVSKKLSELDPLTNVMNRRKFEDLLEKLLLRAQRTVIPMTLMVLDIDNFKGVNDKYGHQAGDRVLVEISYLISSLIRKSDYLVRYGGEEFVIISADSALDGMTQLAEKIRREVESHDFNGIGPITVSMGLAEVMEDDDPQTFFQRADNQLYKAKAMGKNTVCYSVGRKTGSETEGSPQI